MENMITLAEKAKATIKPFEHDSAVIFNEVQLNDFLNLVALEVKQQLTKGTKWKPHQPKHNNAMTRSNYYETNSAH